MTREPRVDGYIEKAQPFARPILEKVRERVHAVVPDVEETIKWSHPTYCKNGKIILGTASFKDVCPDATSDLPVQGGERRIRSDRNLTLGILN